MDCKWTIMLYFLPLVGSFNETGTLTQNRKTVMDYEATKLQRGYAGRMLTIDLAANAIEAPEIEEKVRDYFLGGRGLGLHLLHQSITATTKATDPENPLILANGPLGGIPSFRAQQRPWPSPFRQSPAFLVYPILAAISAPSSNMQVSMLSRLPAKAGRDVMIVIDGLKHKVTVEEISHLDESFDLERMIDERFTAQGIDRRQIAFMSTGIGADNTTFGCINSHYFDVTKPSRPGVAFTGPSRRAAPASARS